MSLLSAATKKRSERPKCSGEFSVSEILVWMGWTLPGGRNIHLLVRVYNQYCGSKSIRLQNKSFKFLSSWWYLVTILMMLCPCSLSVQGHGWARGGAGDKDAFCGSWCIYSFAAQGRATAALVIRLSEELRIKQLHEQQDDWRLVSDGLLSGNWFPLWVCAV